MKRVVVLGILSGVVWAQAPTYPPPLLQLTRKPGISAAIKPYREAKAAVDVVALTSISGLPETWTMELHADFASLEALDQALSAVMPLRDQDERWRDSVMAPPRTMIASYLPDWSYRPDQAIRRFPRARYFLISIYRIRAGTEADYGELVQMRRASRESVNLDRPDLAYEVISGAESGTYIFLAPLTTLKTFDGGTAATPAYAENLADARAKARSKVAPDSELSREHLLLRVEPRLSYVSDEFAAAGEQEFWRPQR